MWHLGIAFCVCVRFFFPWTRVWHCSLSINSDFRLMNNAKYVNSNFFIVFNFQQNKQYPNRPIDQ